MTSSPEKKHVAVFVFPFASHPLTLFNFVLKLAHAAPHLSFSFIGTENSNQPLFSKPQINIPDNIKAYSIGDGVPEGLVLGSHPVEKVNLFLQAGPDNLRKGIDLAVAGTKQTVTCIIADAFVTPSLIVAQDLNVPWIPVWVPSPSSLSAHFHTDWIREQCANIAPDRALDFLPGLSNMRVGDLPDDLLNGGEEEKLFSKTLASLGRVLPQAKAVVVNFYEELDPPLLVQDMRSKLQSMLYVGLPTLSLPLSPLPPSDTDATGCLSWLDKQNARSVAYISFGTAAAPPSHELVALAEALEASGFPFLWSLKDHLKGLLPNGFLGRTSIRGKIVPWAPQTQVLGHDSIGVFVTHCGANSVSESISVGVPMICRPFFAEQRMNGRLVQDIWETGVRVEGGEFSKNRLLESLNLILMQEEGKKMREKALEMKRTLLDAAGPDGKAAQNFKTLLEIVSSS